MCLPTFETWRSVPGTAGMLALVAVLSFVLICTKYLVGLERSRLRGVTTGRSVLADGLAKITGPGGQGTTRYRINVVRPATNIAPHCLFRTPYSQTDRLPRIADSICDADTTCNEKEHEDKWANVRLGQEPCNTSA